MGTHFGALKSFDGGLNWTPINVGLSRWNIVDIVIDPLTPSTLYAADLFGAYKSLNGGSSWINIWSVSPRLIDSINSFAIDPASSSTVYMGDSFDGFMKSVNSGANWTYPMIPSGGGMAIISLAVSPASVYGGFEGAGLGYSVDGGVSWGLLGSGIIGLSVHAIIFDPVTLTTIYVGANNGVFKSVDSGTTWLAVNTGLTTLDVRAMVIDPLIPSTLYAGTFGGGIFKSVDSGATWAAMNTGLANLSIQALAIDPLMPAILYAATAGDGVFQSVDGGTNWAAINTGLASLNVRSIAIDPLNPSIVYVGNNRGVQKGVFDMIAPVITLSGAATVTLTQGGTYTDAGATASDNVDGNITANIIVVNPVNTDVVGSYTITYNVSDAAGNAAAQVSRTVLVIDSIAAGAPVSDNASPSDPPASSGGGCLIGSSSPFAPITLILMIISLVFLTKKSKRSFEL